MKPLRVGAQRVWALPPSGGKRKAPLLTPAVWATAALFAVDMVTNVTDYAFHLYLGWSLAPADFATVQTLNSVLLILITAFAVLQPVVARYVAAFNSQQLTANSQQLTPTPAEAPSTGRQAEGAQIPQGHLVRNPQSQIRNQPSVFSRTVFQQYMRQGLVLGVILFVAAWLLRVPLAAALNVPVAAVAAATFMLLLILLRPVTFGMLQGQQEFVPFGLSRTSFAVGRLALAFLFITILGGGAVAGIAAMPLGALISLLVALAFIGRQAWQPGETLDRSLVREGWRLSLAALIAYTAFMALQNIDLIWANRMFAAPVAGAYATAVVLRRVLVVLPGAIIVILYPRLVTQVERHQLPDRLLVKASAAIAGVTLVLAAFYFLFGPWLVAVMFGRQYADAGTLLGWMAVAMIAYALAAVWLNLFLATRPWPYVAVLAGAAVLQLLLLSRFNERPQQLVTTFVTTGWLVVLSGLLLYWVWLRPNLQKTNNRFKVAAALPLLSPDVDR